MKGLVYRHSAIGQCSRWRAGALVMSALLAIGTIGAQAAADKAAPMPDLRAGFYASGGVAYGSGPVDVTVNSASTSETQTGISFYLAAGIALSPHWRVGGEWDVLLVSGLFSDEVSGPQNGTLNFLSAAVAYYPSLTKAFWVKGNLGWARLSVSSAYSGASSESGFGGGIGAGYDYRLGHTEYVLIPFVNYFTQFSHADLNGFLQGAGNRQGLALPDRRRHRLPPLSGARRARGYCGPMRSPWVAM